MIFQVKEENKGGFWLFVSCENIQLFLFFIQKRGSAINCLCYFFDKMRKNGLKNHKMVQKRLF